MNKSKMYLISALVALVLTGIAIHIRSNRCECKEFKKYETVTVHPDNTFSATTDSICVVGSKPDGSIFLNKFN